MIISIISQSGNSCVIRPVMGLITLKNWYGIVLSIVIIVRHGATSKVRLAKYDVVMIQERGFTIAVDFGCFR